MVKGTKGGYCSVTGDQQLLLSSLRAQVTLLEPSPLEMWRSWSVDWCSAALATRACPWTQQCPLMPSVVLSQTALAEWRVSQVCIHRDVCGLKEHSWWAGGFGVGSSIYQGHWHSVRVETENMSSLC